MSRLALALTTLVVIAAAGVFGVWLATRGDDAPAATGWEGSVRPPGTRLPDFELADQDGESVTGRMDFLLGTRDELEPLWRAFGIAPQRDGAEHSAYTVLVDGEGRQRLGFPASRLTPSALAHDLGRL